jgi:hypothetical protein
MGGIKARMLFNSNNRITFFQVDDQLCHAIVTTINLNPTTGDQGHAIS